MSAGDASFRYSNGDKGSKQKRSLWTTEIAIAVLAACGFVSYRFAEAWLRINYFESIIEKEFNIQLAPFEPEMSLRDDLEFSVTIRNDSQQEVRQLAIVLADNPFENFVLRSSSPSWIVDDRPLFSGTRRLVFGGLPPNTEKTYTLEFRPKIAGDCYLQTEVEFEHPDYGWSSPVTKRTEKQRIVVLP